MDTPPPRTRPRSQTRPARAFEPFANIEIDAVSPSSHGITLTGQGADRAEYRLDMHFDLPLDPRTRTVLGELLSQSEVTLYRRGAPRNS